MAVFLMTSFARFFSMLIKYLPLGLITWPFFSHRMVTSVLVISQLSSASSPGTVFTFSKSRKMCTGFSKAQEMSCYPCHTFNCSSETKKKEITFDEQHSPAAQVFNGEDNVPGISQYCLSNTHFILAAIVDELDVVICDHQLSINGP